MGVGGEVVAEPAADVEDRNVAVVVEIGDHGAGDIPFLPAGQFAQAGLANVEECVVLPASERRDCWSAEIRGVRRSVELAHEGDAGVQCAFGADERGGLLSPRGFAVNLPSLAENAG